MANERFARNAEKAKQLKGKVERHTMNCPCCHNSIPRERHDPKNVGRLLSGGLENHLRVCRG